MVHYVFSNPQVLADCRDELTGITKIMTDGHGTTTHHIDLLSIKTNCPILTSTLQEVLRHRAVGTSVREVMEDTILDGKYFLKKGCTLLIPTDVLHSDRILWGDDVAEFDHRRFLKLPGKKVPNPVAFRAFGGGTTLCPGRHFASTEIMAVAGMLIARFEITPVDGHWPNVEIKDINLWAQIVEADPNFEIDVAPREIFAQGKHRWEFGLSDSEMLFPLAAEDKS
jgi:cytochrome P450